MHDYSSRSDTFSDNDQVPGQPRTVAKKGDEVDFTGASTPAQIRLPQDLLVSLRLHAIKENTSVSKLIHQCLVSKKVITKASVHIRRAA